MAAAQEAAEREAAAQAAAGGQGGGAPAPAATGSAGNSFQDDVNINADLLHLYARSGVPAEIQQKFGQAGMTNLQTFLRCFRMRQT